MRLGFRFIDPSIFFDSSHLQLWLQMPKKKTRKRNRKKKKFMPRDLTQQRRILEECMGCFYFAAWFASLEIKFLLLCKWVIQRLQDLHNGKIFLIENERRVLFSDPVQNEGFDRNFVNHCPVRKSKLNVFAPVLCYPVRYALYLGPCLCTGETNQCKVKLIFIYLQILRLGIYQASP